MIKFQHRTILLKIIILVILFLPSIVLADSKFNYYYFKQPIRLDISSEFFSIKLENRLDERSAEKTIKSYQMERFEIIDVLPGANHFLLKFTKKYDESYIFNLVNEIKRRDNVEYSFPAYKRKTDLLILTNEIVVKFQSYISEHQINRLSSILEAEIIRSTPFGVVQKLPKYGRFSNPLTASEFCVREFEESVQYAQPNFIRLFQTYNAPNDEYFPEQWTLKKANFTEAWKNESNQNKTIVAVLDEGVDRHHPDLYEKIQDNIDFTDRRYPNPCEWDAHGTAVSGIIASITNNKIGIAGAAQSARILSIRVLYNTSADASLCTTRDWWIAWAIDYAWKYGAGVINNSWGFSMPSNLVDTAIRDAINFGRNNKGTVIVFAAGNHAKKEPDQGFQTTNIDDAVVVGATDRNDKRWPYSVFGSSIDVVAPSGDRGQQGDIWTTDNCASKGYNSGKLNFGDAKGDYTKKFGGTSAAAPLVSALTAMLISKDNSLTVKSVSEILFKTADDLLPAGKDKYFGHGRINAAKAMETK